MKYYLLLSFSLLFFTAFAQTGGIKGTVNDEKLERPIFGAKVFIEGTLYGSMTNMNGEFEIKNIKPGIYNVTCFYLLYGNKVIENVEVKAGEVTPLDVPMGQVAKQMGGTTVVIKKEKTTEAAAIDEVKEDNKVVEVVSSQEMSKKGDNKASDAVKRVSGVSVVGGKYVYVRGLSDRYSKTIINGSEVPGLDPLVNSFQMDLMPSRFISSIKVVKTFSPDLPGDFTGGLVDIRTREYPDSFFVKVSANAAYNSYASFNKNYILGDRSSTDWMGFDDGYRSTPDVVKNSINQDLAYQSTNGTEGTPYPTTASNQQNAQTLDNTVKAYNKEMTPSKQNNFLDHAVTITLGNKYKIPLKKDSLKSRTFGFFGGIDYRKSYKYYDNISTGFYQITGDINQVDELGTRNKLRVEEGKESVLIGAYLGTTYKFNDRHKLRLNVLRNQAGESIGRIGDYGKSRGEDFTYRQQTIRYTQRELTSVQLIGDNELRDVVGNNPLKIDWLGSYTTTKMDNPDLRYWSDQYTLNANGDRVYDFNYGSVYQRPARYTRTNAEKTIDGKLNVELPIKYRGDSLEMKIKAGVSVLSRSRDYNELRIDYDPSPAISNGVPYTGDVDAFLQDPNIGWVNQPAGPPYQTGTILLQKTELKNSYTGQLNVMAGYAMIEIPVIQRLDFVGGARLESTYLETNTKDPEKPGGLLESNNLLPSANLIYTVIDGKRVTNKYDSTKTNKKDMKLRLSYNKTLARPTFREITPIAVIDYDRNQFLVGNPDLKITTIDNFDFRWEYYPKTGELISAAVFYKRLTNPIELTYNVRGNNELQWKNPGINADGTGESSASLYGIEIEFRKNLRFLGRVFENFNFGTNVTLSKSKIEYTEQEYISIKNSDPYASKTRPLSGQSPYLINALIEYKNDKRGISANFTYNVFGKRLKIVRIASFLPVYEMPFNTLDFNFNKQITDRLSMTLRAQNLFDPWIKEQYLFDGNNSVYDKFNNQDYYYNRYKLGRRYSIGFNYLF